MRDREEDVRRAASAWFARLQAPDGASDRAGFEAWRREDPAHAAAYDRIDARWRRNAMLAGSRLADAVWLRPALWRRVGLDRPQVYLPAAALSLLVVAGGVAVLHRPSGAPAAYASTVGEIRHLTLTDGSRVTLDTSSALTELFTAGERRVRLERGRARFDVAPDPHRPFAVFAATTRITDRGTVFDVRLDDRGVEVALLRGVVEVAGTAPERRSDITRVLQRPGQRLVVAAGLTPATARVSAGYSADWVSGMLSFRDVPLTQVLKEMNRYASAQIVLGDPALANRRVTGAFRAGAPDDLAANLASLFDLSARADTTGRIVLTAKPPVLAGAPAATP